MLLYPGFTLTLPLIFAAVTVVGKSIQSRSGSCALSWSDNLPSSFPLIHNQASILYPENVAKNEWKISFPEGKSISVSCSSPNNAVAKFNHPSVNVECVDGRLNVQGKNARFSDLGCKNSLTEHLEKVKKQMCTIDGNVTEVQILFKANEKGFPLITICFDPEIDGTIVAHNIIHGSGLNPFEVSNDRPGFKEGGLYSEINVNKAYQQRSQTEILGQLLGSKSLGKTYIDSKKSFYFARGHLAPDGDFVHIYEQNATYFFVNAVPQWQSINNGNWKALETAVRKYAVAQKTSLQIWSGVKGILKLKDHGGSPVEIFLAKDKAGKPRLPAPEIMWKLIYRPDTKAAIVVFMINNPHMEVVDEGLILCEDKCSQVSWIKWKLHTISKGYTYCCDIQSAKKYLSGVPNLGRVDLLT